MDYQQLLQQIETLSAAEPLLSQNAKFMLGRVNYAPAKQLQTPAEVMGELESLQEVTGWITWQDQVERIDTAKKIPLNTNQLPIEAELVTSSGDCIRLAFRNQCWQWIHIQLESASPEQANCLFETTQLQSRDTTLSAMQYTRIWQQDEHHGMIATDAVFVGFGGKQ